MGSNVIMSTSVQTHNLALKSSPRIYLSRGWQNFSAKGQMINILSLATHTVSVFGTQLCHGSLKSATDNTYTNDHAVFQ